MPRCVSLTSAWRQSPHIPGSTGRAARLATVFLVSHCASSDGGGPASQVHFELLADMKFETELTTLPASLVMVAI